MEASADEMEVDRAPKESQSRPRKRRRIVSAATIGSEEDPAPKAPKRKPKADEGRKDGWPTYISRPRCTRCMRRGLRCRSFVLPQLCAAAEGTTPFCMRALPRPKTAMP